MQHPPLLSDQTPTIITKGKIGIIPEGEDHDA